MLKRLNYLRNSLENHNSRETTEHLRNVAERRRDERIMELWKSDLEKPSVYEMVHKMKKQADEDNGQSSKFMAMLNSIQTGETPTDMVMHEGASQDSLAANTSGMHNYFTQGNSTLGNTSTKKPIKAHPL